ncbi:hydroxymethylglutaryl-CoA lyase [Pinisolibacter aquiterrae]|uniref:hydroxymethylglutaryl-CoA lyase n=1 Tax=Pinisolibacter aquiterrae TaxID=2815579 RepID=UPI001E3177A2
MTLVEVGPRDGFQGIGPFIPTETKIDFLKRLAAAGLERIEAGSFVSPTALPQLRDVGAIVAACREIPGLKPQFLVPNARYGATAIEAGAEVLVFVVSVSEAHNRSNVRRHPSESVGECARLIAARPAGVEVRVDVATAFDCPFTGRVAESDVLDLLDRLVAVAPDAELCLCDTTGKATPDHVAALFAAARERFPEKDRWAFHAHDTYGLGLANIHAAWRVGVTIFDAAFAGLGGCPFAPGATGNVATEDVVWMFRQMGVETGVDLDALLSVARDGALLPGGTPGGRIRDALGDRGSPTCGA